MRVAIICLRGKAAPPEDQWAARRAMRLAALDEAQALGIARAMRDRGRLAPMLVINKGSLLEQKALEYGIPCLQWGFFSRFQLWRWQRKHSRLIIQTVGQESMRAGRMLLKMRKKDTAILAHAFFLKAPEGKNLTGKAMLAASRVLCGSGHVEERINEGLTEPTTIKTIIDQPGIEMENWLPCRLWGEDGNRRFVFGMAQSLEPQSGALLVIRAMSALWQRPDLPPWEVRMFGSGPRFREVLNEAENLGVASRLSLLADQPLPVVLPWCHAWLAPGTNPREYPETAWAGIAAGAPLICVISPLHSERLKAAENAPAPALRVPGNDPQSLARAMISLMRDGRLRARLVHGGEAIRPEIGIEAMAQRTLGFYEQWAEELEGKPEPALAPGKEQD